LSTAILGIFIGFSPVFRITAALWGQNSTIKGKGGAIMSNDRKQNQNERNEQNQNNRNDQNRSNKGSNCDK